jgi:hypothetical protein
MRPIQQINLPTTPPAQVPLDTNTPPATVVKKKFPLPKNVLVLFGAILICLTALGGLYVLPANQKKLVPIRQSVSHIPPTKSAPSATPQPTAKLDPTANWKTYANKSFSIRYPERFTITEKSLPVTSKYPKVYTTIILSDVASDITITVAKNTPQLKLENALGNGPYLRYSDTLLTKPVSTVLVDGNDGKMAQAINAGAAGVRADIVTVAHGKVYEMTLSPIGVDAEVFALIVSTMKLLNQEPSDSTDEWPVHVDTPYKFSFRYPTLYSIEYNKVASGSPTLTSVYDNAKINLDAPRFKIEVQDIRNFGQSAVTSRQILQLPLIQYVDKKWEYNKIATDAAIPNRTIGPIKQTAVDGKTAYSFTVSGKYIDDHTQEILSGSYTFVFTENNGYKYKIWFPSNDTIETQIFNTFIFLQ